MGAHYLLLFSQWSNLDVVAKGDAFLLSQAALDVGRLEGLACGGRCGDCVFVGGRP